VKPSTENGSPCGDKPRMPAAPLTSAGRANSASPENLSARLATTREPRKTRGAPEGTETSVRTTTSGSSTSSYLNVPIGVAAISVTYLKLRESRDPHATHGDWAGVATFSASLFLLVLALLRGNDECWGSGLIVSLFAGLAALLATFVAVERIVGKPMLPLGLFKIASFTGVQLAAFAISGSLFAVSLYLSLYLQNHLGYSPFETGLRYLPITLAVFVFSAVVAGLIGRVPARVLMSAGLALSGIGLLLMSGIAVASEWTTLLAGFLVAGVGAGLVNPVIADVAVSVIPKERSGMAAGINDTFRQVGVAVGIALWGAIFLGRGTDKVEQLAAGSPAADGDRARELVEAASSGTLDQAVGGLPPQAREVAASAAREGFVAGLNDVLMLGGVLSIVGAVLALWLVRERELEREAAESKAPPAVDLSSEAA
jgi:hypothetical protein